MLDHDSPVIIHVYSPTEAVMTYRRATVRVTGDDAYSMKLRLRRQVAEWSMLGSGGELPIVLFSTHGEAEIHYLTGDEYTDFRRDKDAPEQYRARAEFALRGWLVRHGRDFPAPRPVAAPPEPQREPDRVLVHPAVAEALQPRTRRRWPTVNLPLPTALGRIF